MLWLGYILFYKKINVTNEAIQLKIDKGLTFKTISQKLSTQLPINQKLIYYTGILFDLDNKIQAGVYIIPTNLTIWDILKKLAKGDIATYKFTIVEGWNFKQIQNALDNSNIKHTIPNITSTDLAKILKVDTKNIEGWLYPKTYYYNDNSTDFEIYQQALYKMQKTLDAEWQKKSKNLYYKNKYQALIVASLIERETYHQSEYKKIAAVILNRLEKNMRLQIDAAVLYGLNKTNGPLTKKDLSINTKYNLYKIKGLPPTPIAMPIKQAIIAAMNPDSSKNLYYVLSTSGKHIFTTNYKDHLIAVKKLRAHQSGG